jgi:hypothetical protein
MGVSLYGSGRESIHPLRGTAMMRFLQRFGTLVSGVLKGFDRLVFRGKLRELYHDNGMGTLLGLNGIACKDYKIYAASIKAKLLAASLLDHAKELGRYQWVSSNDVAKEDIAREIAAKHQVKQGLVCVLQCLEPCWTFDRFMTPEGFWDIRGGVGKGSHLYHYYIHPQFGWMYVRLQTWFPFDIQVGINGREWLARQMDKENLKYERSDNKFLWIEDWQRAQQLLDQQLQTDWACELNALQKQVHPTHPRILGRKRAAYYWTVGQSEWATDVAFHSEKVLKEYFDRWLRQAFLSYDAVDVLRFLGCRSQRISRTEAKRVETSFYDRFDGKRIKHWLYENSLKLYSHFNVLRDEMTMNNPYRIQVLRKAQNDPKFIALWRPIRRGIVDLPHRVQVGQASTERYLDALVALAETRTLKQLAEPLTCRVPEPQGKTPKPPRQVRGLNPLAAADGALLSAVADPKWMIHGLRNRDIAAALYPTPAVDTTERRRRSAHVTHLLRLLRAHGLLEKIPGTHRYQVCTEARMKIHALLAVQNVNPDELTSKAA